MQKPVRIAAPAETPVSLAEIKAHCVVDHDSDDTLLASLGQAATDHLDGWSGILGRCLVTQTWRVVFDRWPPRGLIRLPFPDVTAVAVTYWDADDAEQTVNAALHEIIGPGGRYGPLGCLRFKSAFTRPDLYDDRHDAVHVDVTAGFGAASDVPEALKTAIKMLVAHWYEHREAVAMGAVPADVPMAVDSLVGPYRAIKL